MKIVFTADCAVKGTHYDQGEEAEFDDGLANHLVSMGRARKLAVKGSKGAVENRDPETENRDPKAKGK